MTVPLPRIVPTDLPPVVILEHPVFTDHRGTFREIWREDVYTQVLGVKFVQANVSFSKAGTLRGLHFQYDRPQAKLITVLAGRIFDVAVDVRRGSPTFGRWTSIELIAAGRQVFIPSGFAHGFLALEPSFVEYKCTEYYDLALDATLRWNDPALVIRWPTAIPTLSARDSDAPLLSQLDLPRLPGFHR